MNLSDVFHSTGLAAGLLLAGVLTSGCASSSGGPATPPPHAFIRYDPPPKGDKGLRLAVKDLIDIEGQVTSAGSRLLYETAAPATKDAECLRIARNRGVTIVGKASLSEFAIGVSGSNDYFGTPINPVAEDRIPGGSSSGSAVAVARDLADVALGTDTAGSIRVPAACCGVYGLKTTFGLVPLEGVYPISYRYLDTVGPLARDVDGLVKGMDLLQDGFASRYAEARRAKPTARSVRIGRLYVPGTDPAIDSALDKALVRKGFRVTRLGDDFLHAWEQAQHDGNRVAEASAWVTNQEFRRRRQVSWRAKLAIIFGDIVYSIKYSKPEERVEALERREVWREHLRTVFKNVDAIALPVLKDVPPRVQKRMPAAFESMVLAMQNTVAVNYAGNPALAIPVPLDRGDFPVTSLQLIGPPNSEARLLNIGRLVQSK
jgi:amidase